MLHVLINVIRMLAQALGLSSSPPIEEKEDELSSLPPSKSTTEAQFNFWERLFQATADSEGDPQVVYPLLDNQSHLLDDNFAILLGNWATIIFREVESEQRYNFANTIAIFSELIREFPRGHRDINLKIAITGNRVATIVFTRQAFPADWAMLQNNLGLAYCQRIRGNRADNLELAIRYYLATLEVRTRQAFSYDWAVTQNNLGNAYRNRIQGEKAENLENAIYCFQNTLEIFTPETYPEEWAQTQDNLSNANLYGSGNR